LTACKAAIDPVLQRTAGSKAARIAEAFATQCALLAHHLKLLRIEQADGAGAGGGGVAEDAALRGQGFAVNGGVNHF
jgi:hypothetical protein